MGLLQQEGRRYRLPKSAVEKGLGIRHDKPKSGYPFDVLSPVAQELIAQVWDETVEDYEASVRAQAGVEEARAALKAFQATRIGEPMNTQLQVWWVRSHFPGMTEAAVADVLEVTPPLVRRYTEKQKSTSAYWERYRASTSYDEAERRKAFGGSRGVAA